MVDEAEESDGELVDLFFGPSGLLARRFRLFESICERGEVVLLLVAGLEANVLRELKFFI